MFFFVRTKIVISLNLPIRAQNPPLPTSTFYLNKIFPSLDAFLLVHSYKHNNGYIITWMLYQIFIYSKNLYLKLTRKQFPKSTPFTLSPPLLLDKRTDQKLSSMLASWLN